MSKLKDKDKDKLKKKIKKKDDTEELRNLRIANAKEVQSECEKKAKKVKKWL